MPIQVRWHKYHGLPKFPIEIGLGSSFPKGAKFSFREPLCPPDHARKKVIYRAVRSQVSDKAYLPADHVFANFSKETGRYDSGSVIFTPFVVSPEAKHHQLEFHRKGGAFMVCGRHGEPDAFGFSVSDRGDPNYVRLAFPNETGAFPDLFILIERRVEQECRCDGECTCDELNSEPEYNVIEITSGFAKPYKFVVGEPIVVNWEIVDLTSAPDCLKKAVEDRKEELKNQEKTDDFVSSFAQRRGLTRE